MSYIVRKNGKQCIDELEDSLPGKNIGAASTFETEICGWARNEDSELNPGREPLEGLWTGRAEVLSKNGKVTDSDIPIIPKCPIIFSMSWEFLKQSNRTVQSFLELVCQSIVANHSSSEEN